MKNELITVTCPSCGAILKVDAGSRGFVCDSCGRSSIVDRKNRGDPPVLKTGAGPASIRLEKELSQLVEARDAIAAGNQYPVLGLAIFFFVVGVAEVAISLIVQPAGIPFWGPILAIALIVVIPSAIGFWFNSPRNIKKWMGLPSIQLSTLDAAIAGKQAELRHQQEQVSRS